jgi:hypothetical protein
VPAPGAAAASDAIAVLGSAAPEFGGPLDSKGSSGGAARGSATPAAAALAAAAETAPEGDGDGAAWQPARPASGDGAAAAAAAGPAPAPAPAGSRLSGEEERLQIAALKASLEEIEANLADAQAAPLLQALADGQLDLRVVHGQQTEAAAVVMRCAARLRRAAQAFEGGFFSACRLAQGAPSASTLLDAESIVLKVGFVDDGQGTAEYDPVDTAI